MMSSTNTSTAARVIRWHSRWTYKGSKERCWTVRQGLLRTQKSFTPKCHCLRSTTGKYRFFYLYSRILKLGFRCVGISPGFLDPTTWEVLQVDATFVTECEPADRLAKIA